MKRMTGIALLAAFSFSGTAGAQEWRAATENTQVPLTLMFVDAAGLVREKDIAIADLLTVMQDQPETKPDWNYSILRRKIDCHKGEAQILNSRFFKDEAELGQDTQPSDWLPIRKGSMLEGVADVVCGRKDYLTPPAENPVGVAQVYFTDTTRPKK